MPHLDGPTILALGTSLASVIAALAAAYNTVRKTEVETLRKLIAQLETRIAALEADLSAERSAHKEAREELAQAREELATAYADLQQCQKALARRPAARARPA